MSRKEKKAKAMGVRHALIRSPTPEIEPDPAHPRFLTTISRVGYRFNDNDDE